MPQFENIETVVLIGILAEYTEEYTRLFRLNTGLDPSPEYLWCKKNLEAVQEELNKRNLSHEKIVSQKS